MTVQSTQAHLHIRSAERHGASIVSYSLQVLCPGGGAGEGGSKSTSFGEGGGGGESERKEQSSPAWCDLVIVKETPEEEPGAEEEDGVEEEEEEEEEMWALGCRDAHTGQTLTWTSTEKEPVVVTNGYKVRERLQPGALCEVRDTDGKWKAAVIDRDTIAGQDMDAMSESPRVGAYLVTFLEEAKEVAAQAKKSKRRTKGGGRL